MSVGHRLEQYTLQRPQEVLIVKAEIAGEEDEIAIFRGFSSSLMRPTAFDVDVPILPEGRHNSVDRSTARPLRSGQSSVPRARSLLGRLFICLIKAWSIKRRELQRVGVGLTQPGFALDHGHRVKGIID